MRINRLTWFLSQNLSPVDTNSNLPSHSQPTTNPLPYLIEPDDHIINNAEHVDQLNAVMQCSGDLLEHYHLIKGPDSSMWKKSLANDLGRLAQGVGTRMKQGTNTISFMHQIIIPKNKKITHVKLVSAIRPLKEEVNRRVIVAVEGDRLEHNGFTHTVPADISAVKIHLNSTISTPESRNCTAGMKGFYCETHVIDPNDY